MIFNSRADAFQAVKAVMYWDIYNDGFTYPDGSFLWVTHEMCDYDYAVEYPDKFLLYQFDVLIEEKHYANIVTIFRFAK